MFGKKKEKINGEKADIFSLGVVLFNLVTGGKYGFFISQKIDPKYKCIVDGKFDEYWKGINMENLSEDFKKLYFKMVHPNPSLRPSLDDILLKDPWLKEVNQIDEEQIKNELNGIYEKIIENNQNQIDIDNQIKLEGLITRSINDSKTPIFTNKNLKPTYIPKDRININPYIKINGNFSRFDFMQTLADAISYKFGENCLIEGSKESLSFEIIFEYENENEELEIGNCKMVIELFEYENKECLLEFRRIEGNRPYYDYHLKKIKEIIKEYFSKKK